MVLGAMQRNTDRCVLCFHGCGAATKPIDDQTDSVIEKSPLIEGKQYVAIYKNGLFQAARDITETLQRSSRWPLILKMP